MAAPPVVAGDDATRNKPDPFFDKHPDVLKSYSFNYEALAAYKREVHWSNMIVGNILCVPCAVCAVVNFFACDADNINDETKARHIALTADGIRYIVDKHPTACRLDCQLAGRTSQTVPYDKITDCDVEEPAGAEGCCCALVQRTMYTFNVATANGTALELWGIDAPYELKKDVWSMKRGQGIEGVSLSELAPSAVSMVRDAGGGMVTHGGGGMPVSSAYAPHGGGSSSFETERLLGEILQTLKEQSKILQAK